MSAHTPGPWEAIGVAVFSEGGREIIFGKYNTRSAEKAEREANAKLIAAAPDLLALLVDFERVAAMDFSVNRNDSLLDLASRARGIISTVTP